MLDEMTLSNGREWFDFLSSSRRISALIASSPRTAYSTLRRAGLSESSVRGRIGVGNKDLMSVVDRKFGRRRKFLWRWQIRCPTIKRDHN